MGTVIAVEALVMLLLVLNGWRSQVRDWQAERRSAEAGHTQQDATTLLVNR